MKRAPGTLARPALILALALLAPALAMADKIRPLGDGPAHGKTLTKAQLEQCLRMQPKVVKQSEAIERSKSELDAAKAAFDRIDAEIRNGRSGVNPHDKAAVDAYNAKIDRRHSLLADYRAKAPAFNEQANAYNVLRQSWTHDCEDRPYHVDDYGQLVRKDDDK